MISLKFKHSHSCTPLFSLSPEPFPREWTLSKASKWLSSHRYHPWGREPGSASSPPAEVSCSKKLKLLQLLLLRSWLWPPCRWSKGRGKLTFFSPFREDKHFHYYRCVELMTWNVMALWAQENILSRIYFKTLLYYSSYFHVRWMCLGSWLKLKQAASFTCQNTFCCDNRSDRVENIFAQKWEGWTITWQRTV